MDGMEIGSHTYDHITLSTATAEQIQDTMNKNDALLQKLINFTPTIMRPTGGGVNDTVTANVNKPLINWDVDTQDWKTKNADQTIATATTDVKDGSIILMHDLYQSTAEATVSLVPRLQQMGYKLVTVSELAETYGYKLEAGRFTMISVLRIRQRAELRQILSRRLRIPFRISVRSETDKSKPWAAQSVRGLLLLYKEYFFLPASEDSAFIAL